MSDVAGLSLAAQHFMAHDTCRSCGQCPRNETWRGFALPRGTDFLVDVPCTPNEELGRNDAWLPVTHTAVYLPGRSPGGVWLYYMRGCSDLLWNAGRTLLARNKVHAALLFESRLRQRGVAADAALPVEEDAALLKAVTSRLLATDDYDVFHRGGPGDRGMTRAKWLQRINRSAAPFLRAKRRPPSIEGAIAEAASLFEPLTRCNPSPSAPEATRCRGPCLTRMKALAFLSATAWFDWVLYSQIKSARGTPAELDSIQLHMQPQASGSVRWVTELWDVREVGIKRSRLKKHAAKKNAPDPNYTHGHGNRLMSPSTGSTPACMPSLNWTVCRACAGSQLERLCRTRERQAWCDTEEGRRYRRQRNSRPSVCG